MESQWPTGYLCCDDATFDVWQGTTLSQPTRLVVGQWVKGLSGEEMIVLFVVCECVCETSLRNKCKYQEASTDLNPSNPWWARLNPIVVYSVLDAIQYDG